MRRTAIRVGQVLYGVTLLAACMPPPATAQDTPPLSLGTNLQPWSGDLDGMIKRRIIRVLVPYSKTLYFVDLGGQQRGISYDLMRAYENQVNKKNRRGNLRVHVIMIPVARDRLLHALVAGDGDIVAANLTITPERERQVDFTTPLARNVRELIVTGPGAPTLTALEDLAGTEIFVSPVSSYRENLLALNRQFGERHLPPMILRDVPGHFETEDVLEMANAGLAPIVVADAYIAQLWRQIYRQIQVRDDLVLNDDGDIAFAVRKNSPKILNDLNDFMKKHRKGTTFGNVTLQKYLQQTKWVRNANAPAALKRFNRLVKLFQKYGDRYRIDSLLMAAQGYQESQLNQSRRSEAGAIGVMQIMPATGEQMGVGDITELEPNIHAGAKYLRHLIDAYFNDDSIDELNQTLFAFAAYNAGPTRVRSLQREAKRKGLDSAVWFNNVERVAASRIGRETVQYVSNIYKYYFAYTLVRTNVQRDLQRKPPPR